MAVLNIYANGRLIGQSANCVKTLWGLVAPLPQNPDPCRSMICRGFRFQGVTEVVTDFRKVYSKIFYFILSIRAL
jgi:hypothetical protein